MHIQRGIKFILHKRNPNQVQNLGIRLRVTLRGKTPIDFPLGFSTDIENWDASEQVAIGGDDMAAINRTIKEWRNTLDEIFARYELIEKRTPEPDELKDLFNDTIGRQTDLKKELDKLEAERTVRGHNRNLVVAATGTGKTVISALDYKRFCKQHPGKPCRRCSWRTGKRS